MPKNVIQIMCKHKTIDADFSPKTMECFMNILDEDDDAVYECKTYEEEADHYRKLSEKDVSLFNGEKVNYGDYICYMQDVKEE